MNLITGVGEASVSSSPDISIDLLFFLPQAVKPVAAEKQIVLVKTVDVVEDDETKNNRPFRLQNQIIFINSEMKVLSFLLVY